MVDETNVIAVSAEILPSILTEDQKSLLAEQELVIDEYRKSYQRAGHAMRIIHDGGLYADYGTFEDYAFNRWKYKRQHAYRLMNASEVYDLLEETGWTPENEAQARPLTAENLTDTDKKNIAVFIQKTAEEGQKIDTNYVKSLATIYSDIKRTGAIDGGDGVMIPIEQASSEHIQLALTEEQVERLKRQKEILSSKNNQKFIARFHGIPIVLGEDSFEIKPTNGEVSELRLGHKYLFIVYELQEE